MNNEQVRYIEEDEIDLKELWKTLMKRKMFIIGFTSIVTILAIVWVLTRTPIYEVKSNIQIGFIGEKLITDPATLIKTINILFNIQDKILTKEKFISEVSSVTLNKKLKNFIKIKTQAISNDEALIKNKEVVSYIQNKYKHKKEQYILSNHNDIKSIQVKINNLDNLETENLKRTIKLLKTQKIVKIDEKIKFYKNTKIVALKEKIKFHSDTLIEYRKAVQQISQNNKINTDNTLLMISSLQMLNYQNLILNSLNKLEDLKIEIDRIKNETISNLEIEKKNIQNDTLRKLEYQLNIELANKKVKLLEQIEQLKLKNTEQYIQNSKLIGNYIIEDNPIKPKKKLIVIVAFVTGLILSIFLVFFLEFIGKNEEDKII